MGKESLCRECGDSFTRNRAWQVNCRSTVCLKKRSRRLARETFHRHKIKIMKNRDKRMALLPETERKRRYALYKRNTRKNKKQKII